VAARWYLRYGLSCRDVEKLLVERGIDLVDSMGQLAAALGCSPRVTSYHCDHLEAAGLILRERRGKSVWVSRTARGYELVDMLSA
jgi:hypothetical protein